MQSAVEEYRILRTHRLAIGLYDLTDDGLMARDSIEVDIGGERTPVEALIGVQRPDLVLLNDRDLSYVKVRLDPGSLRTVHGHLITFG